MFVVNLVYFCEFFIILNDLSINKDNYSGTKMIHTQMLSCKINLLPLEFFSEPKASLV